jgi:DNA repair exonuclease SbcCD ATPase subunit
MPGFFDAFRQGRDQARAARGAPPLANGDNMPPPAWDEAGNDAAGPDDPAGLAELQATLQEREAKLAENQGLIAELKDYAEQLQARADQLAEQTEQLQAERDQFANVLKGPGVRKLLILRFHSDKAAKTSAAEREKLDAFTAKLNAAYDLIEKIDKAAAEAAAQARDEAESDGEE